MSQDKKTLLRIIWMAPSDLKLGLFIKQSSFFQGNINVLKIAPVHLDRLTRLRRSPVVNFINILEAAFVPIFLSQKITKTNWEKLCKILL